MGTKNGSQDSAPPPTPRVFNGFSEIASFIWSVADLLRGGCKQTDFRTSRQAIITAAVTGKIDVSREVA